MDGDLIIGVEGLWKRYGFPPAAALRRAIGRVATPASSRDDGPWALRDVSFGVRRGETLGIVGRNGAGKSTLLKVLAGVTPPTRGTVRVSGRVFPMIELNAGMHVELSGRENMRLLGALMGLRRRELEAKIPAIEEFCELGAWLDRPVRTYSSGMIARLGFAVAVNVRADILLVDEVLATGDVAFQRKCLDRISELIGQGVTLLLVSHNPYQVERVCSTSLLLSGGAVSHRGAPAETLSRYFEEALRPLAAPDGSAAPAPPSAAPRPGTGDVRLEELQVLGAEGSPAGRLPVNAACVFRLRLSHRRTVTSPHLHLALYDDYNTLVTQFQADPESRRGFVFDRDGWVQCRVDRLPLMPGRYSIGVKIGGGDILIDAVARAGCFEIEGSEAVFHATSNNGLVYVPASWSFAGDPP